MEIINAFHRTLHSCSGMGNWDKMVGKSKVCMGERSQLNLFVRASDISRKKTQNFAGFSGAKSRKNRPISRDFRGKKVKICGKIGGLRRIFAGKSQNSQENRPISRHFSGKKSNFEGFSGANS